VTGARISGASMSAAAQLGAPDNSFISLPCAAASLGTSQHGWHVPASGASTTAAHAALKELAASAPVAATHPAAAATTAAAAAAAGAHGSASGGSASSSSTDAIKTADDAQEKGDVTVSPHLSNPVASQARAAPAAGDDTADATAAPAVASIPPAGASGEGSSAASKVDMDVDVSGLTSAESMDPLSAAELEAMVSALGAPERGEAGATRGEAGLEPAAASRDAASKVSDAALLNAGAAEAAGAVAPAASTAAAESTPAASTASSRRIESEEENPHRIVAGGGDDGSGGAGAREKSGSGGMKFGEQAHADSGPRACSAQGAGLSLLSLQETRSEDAGATVENESTQIAAEVLFGAEVADGGDREAGGEGLGVALVGDDLPGLAGIDESSCQLASISLAPSLGLDVDEHSMAEAAQEFIRSHWTCVLNVRACVPPPARWSCALGFRVP